MGELLRHILGNPGGPQAHADLPGGQVLGLHLFQCLHVCGIGGIGFRGLSCGFQLFPHVAGEVLVRRDVVGTSVWLVLSGHGENDAPQLLRHLLLSLPGEGGHISQVYPGFFPQGHGQGFGRRIHMGDSPVGLDGAL